MTRFGSGQTGQVHACMRACVRACVHVCVCGNTSMPMKPGIVLEADFSEDGKQSKNEVIIRQTIANTIIMTRKNRNGQPLTKK